MNFQPSQVSARYARNETRQSAEVEDDRGLGRVPKLSLCWSLRRFSGPAATALDKISIGVSVRALSEKVSACGMAVLLCVLGSASGCTKKCQDSAACGENETCVVSIQQCRKVCTSSLGCSGNQLCTNLGDRSACLEPDQQPSSSGPRSEDQSLGNQCASPNDDGVSTPTDKLGACGDNAKTCNTTFGTGAGGLNPQTCTVECETDDDAYCAAQVPPRCIGDCAAAYDNMCCIPRLAPAVQFGQKKDASNNLLKLYCRPRLTCYVVSKRCTGSGACPGPRAGNCKPTADGGGECSQGTRQLYECCMRYGECDASKDYLCMPSLSGAAAYCSRTCTSDADCAAPAGTTAVTASCWTNTLVATSTPGKCLVAAAASGEAFCRNKAKPCAPNSPAGQCNVSPSSPTAADLVDCALDDVAAPFSDNHYDATLKRCVFN